MPDRLQAFGRLLNIMDDLREKCPWDRKQTIESLRKLTIEETYELADAIADGDLDGVKEELGDLMLHIVFYAKIGQEKGAFTMAQVINEQCDKLIQRHPHVYGNLKVQSEEDVKRNWENLKLQEGKESVLGGVPRSLPALVKAYRIQEKAKQVGFEWDTRDQVWEKVDEEMQELKQFATNPDTDRDRLEDEFGDVLFSLINYARFLDIDPELALERTNKKFITRFQTMESAALKSGKDLRKMTLAEMDELWNQAKGKERA